jgi:hypothetical protein
MKLKITVVLALLLGSSALVLAGSGPETSSVDLDAYKTVIYVSAATGSDAEGKGSKLRPWATVGQALRDASGKRRGATAILVAAGLYEEHSLNMRSGTHLYGGFDPSDWSRDIWVSRSVLDAKGAGRVLVAADNARLDGFEVKGGLVRGPGAGVFIDGASPTLSNNFFTGNKTLGPEDWAPEFWHETANDGAAVYCTNGGKPEVHKNIFVGNRTDNGRGAGIGYDDHCGGAITRNIFIDNVAGLDDPMRSSDGGAISIFRWSSPVIANNVVLSNTALA